MLLFDTDVMVDLLRRYEPALHWLSSLGDEPIGLPGLVAMELLQGCRNQSEQRQIERVLDTYILFWPGVADCQRALRDFRQSHLQHSLGLLDALIAETAVGLNVPLATFNKKHYTAVASLKTIQPYARDT